MRHGRFEVRWMNPKLGQWRASSDVGWKKNSLGNGQNLIVHSGNYWYSSLSVASIDEKIRTANKRLP